MGSLLEAYEAYGKLMGGLWEAMGGLWGADGRLMGSLLMGRFLEAYREAYRGLWGGLRGSLWEGGTVTNAALL